jgi:hypothetical protein
VSGKSLFFGVAVTTAFVIVGCGGSPHHYSAEKFRRCLVTQHVAVTLTRDPGSESTAALLMQPTFAEWVYFFKTPQAARSDLRKLRHSSLATQRTLARLYRTQRSNILVFAPAKSDWFSPIKRCLSPARA